MIFCMGRMPMLQHGLEARGTLRSPCHDTGRMSVVLIDRVGVEVYDSGQRNASVGARIMAKGGMFGALAAGGIAMLGIGLMRGAMNAASEVVTQRQIQDQRYARNITMMSRLGYSSGTSQMNRFRHTAGLTQALSANRHGRGGY